MIKVRKSGEIVLRVFLVTSQHSCFFRLADKSGELQLYTGKRYALCGALNLGNKKQANGTQVSNDTGIKCCRGVTILRMFKTPTGCKHNVSATSCTRPPMYTASSKS